MARAKNKTSPIALGLLTVFGPTLPGPDRWLNVGSTRIYLATSANPHINLTYDMSIRHGFVALPKLGGVTVKRQRDDWDRKDSASFMLSGQKVTGVIQRMAYASSDAEIIQLLRPFILLTKQLHVDVTTDGIQRPRSSPHRGITVSNMSIGGLRLPMVARDDPYSFEGVELTITGHPETCVEMSVKVASGYKIAVPRRNARLYAVAIPSDWAGLPWTIGLHGAEVEGFVRRARGVTTPRRVWQLARPLRDYLERCQIVSWGA